MLRNSFENNTHIQYDKFNFITKLGFAKSILKLLM